MAHGGQDGFGHQETRLEVLIDDVVPIVFLNFPGALDAGDTGVVDEDVGWAELFGSLVNQAGDLGRAGNLGLDGNSSTAQGQDANPKAMGSLGGSAVVNDNIDPGLGKG